MGLRKPQSTLMIVGLMMSLVSLAGCKPPEAHFAINKVYLRKGENSFNVAPTDEQIQNYVDALAAMFGTPDKPFFVSDSEAGTDGFVDIDRLVRAAGPVKSELTADENAVGRGLFREHCVHCHGVTGDGKGPTASFLNPYPRDFRMGSFKFKSTPKGSPPTHDDLRRLLTNGVEGTAMPSFRLLPDGEIEALIDYVKYLSTRGMVERYLIDDTIDLAPAVQDEESEDAEAEEALDKLDTSRENLVLDKLGMAVANWRNAQPTETPEPNVPMFTVDRNELSQEEEEALDASIKHGRELYYGNIANCFSCHGDTQLGDGQVTDYDDWTKELYDWAKETDEDESRIKMEEFESLDGLKPRNIRPRNLRQGQYRGGRRPIDIFWRIHNGIEGSPMPAATLKPEGAGPEYKGLTTDDVWDLVNFVLSLPYDPLSRPGLDLPANQRVRL